MKSRPSRFWRLGGSVRCPRNLKICQLGLILLVVAALGPTSALAQSTRPTRDVHIVVVVFDGLRPDSVTEQDMPNLYALGQSGTRFSRHHPVYPSSTEVNGTALATGGYPKHTGVMANKEYRPEIDQLKSIAIEDQATVRKGDAVSHGKYIQLPTVAETLRAAGMRTAVAGTKPVALLLDRAPRDAKTGHQSEAVIEGKALSPGLLQPEDAAGFPAKVDNRKSPNRVQDEWTTRMLIHRLWADGVPEYSVLWLSDPDYTQHGFGPNSPRARQALNNSDADLGRVLEALDKLGIRNKTDVLVVSDHGFSTITKNYDLTKVLRKAGFDAANTFSAAPRAGQVVVVGNSGSACLYVIGHDKAVSQRLVEFLQKSAFAGTIFSRDAFEGTFSLSQVGVDTSGAPDVLFSARWSADPNHDAMPGTLVSEGKRGPGEGNHSSLSRYDMHNTLIAAGPSFKQHFVDELPSGNADVAPTILHLLGFPTDQMDGRVLGEALLNDKAPSEPVETQTLRAAHDVEGTRWQQYLTISRIGNHVYFDEGNRGNGPEANDRR
jgi:predicted AlkP superfamily pyrophosphatase or phosphodiesterase